jgi:SAM-dependent methyltransferase
MRSADVSQLWRRNHPWAAVYDFVIERERLAAPLGRLLFGTDIARLYEAAETALGGLADGASVLDIPCGGGVALRGLDPGRHVRYVAADIAPAMLDRARREAAARGLHQVELVEADVEALPFADGEFDLCLTFTGLHCFPHPRVAVTELARCTAPGGRIVGSWLANDTGAVYEPSRRLGRVAGLLGPSCSIGELTGWLAAAGVGEILVQRSGALAYFTARRKDRN